MNRFIILFCGLVLTFILSGCEPIYITSGYVPFKTDEEKISLGSSTKQDILNLWGQPTIVDVYKQDVWTYVYTKKQRFMFFTPWIIEKKLIELTFDSNGLVLFKRTLHNTENIFEMDVSHTPIYSNGLTITRVIQLNTPQQ